MVALAKRAGKSVDRDKVLVANELAFQNKKKQLEKNNLPTMKERTKIMEEIAQEQKGNYVTRQNKIVQKKTDKHMRRV